MSDYRLSELLDLTIMQKMADAHYQAAGMPIGIIDALDGSILVGSGWQDICVKFHRAYPDSLRRCQESDDFIKGRLVEGEACQYKCKNGLWDIGIPIVVARRHLATMFLGQFFYEGEAPDRGFFINLAHELSFDVDEYLAALDRVPVFSREKVHDIVEYDKALVRFISDLGEHALSKIKADKIIRENERRFYAIFDQSYQLLWSISIDGRVLEVNKTALKVGGVEEVDVIGKPFWETSWWAHSPVLQEKLRLAVQQVANGEVIRFEATYPATDGSLYYFDFSLKPIIDEAGKVVLLIGDGQNITERKRAEEELSDNSRFFENMDRVNRAMQGTNDLDQMMSNVLDVLLSIFDCDRAWLVYPCDPEAASWRVSMERNRPDYPGALDMGVDEVPMDSDVVKVFQTMRASSEPVTFGHGSDQPLVGEVPERLREQSQIAITLYPKVGKPWLFGLHQCSYQRVWRLEEKKLIQEIGRRLTDGLTSLLAYRELHDSEELYHSLFDNMLNGFAYCRMIFDQGRPKDFICLEVNNAFESLTGLKNVIGKKVSEVIPGIQESDPELFEILGRVASTGNPERSEIYVKALEQWLAISVYNPGEECFTVVFDVITEHKRSEEKLMSQMEFVTTLLDTIPNPVFYKDCQGRYISCNRAFEQFYGMLREEIAGKTVYEIAPKEIADEYRRKDDELFVHPGTQTYEWAVQSADGVRHDVIYHKATFDGPDGSVAGLVGVVVDITERKRMEQSICESEGRLRTLLQTIPDLIWLKDAQGVYLACNTIFERFFGAKEEDIVGKTDYDFVEKDLADFFREQDRKAVAAGKPSSNEEWITFADDGHRAFLDTVKTPMFDVEGKLVGVLGIARDITERKRAEEEKAKLEGQLQQAQKMESVGRLAGGVAHDFNNMLNVIIGYTELSLSRVDTANPLFAALQEIRKAAERSADLTRQLLAFARKQTIAPRVIDLNVTVESILKMLRRLIGEDIDLAWLPGAKVWALKVDPSQIDQILANLCVNARDAVAGPGRVTIETGNATFDEAYCAGKLGSASGDYVMLAVSDDGHGMDKETMDNIFEPFFTTKGIGRGTGLGLATVYGIVKQNKGFINVYSEPGHGTTFKIYLPRHAAETEQMEEESPATPTARGHETILLVEDEPTILYLAKLMLESFGYRVLAASTPGEAIQMAKEHADEINLLMVDVVMPEMNGPDLAKYLLSLYPGLRCLFMSGYTANIIAHRGVLDEGVSFIQKPFSMQALAAKVREALDNQ
ncbi:PAS domain S-box-containing protein [Syntrophus gentianae]|uniref:histidine kinase n=1 Tax=Syntrophus gentianae TaxID=43775 RepID=A0A1H7WMX7_9BACT|nr:PAS domain S-box protein [Syntrophus gentianae]SEM22781.1 PAS domain S-box-containing protein [Syntrophus gentianae]